MHKNTNNDTTGANYCTLNKAGRAALTAQFGIGADDCNAYVGKNNVNVELLTLAQANAEAIKLALTQAETETAFYLTEGEGGMHGGKCFVADAQIGERKLRVIQHPSGTFVFDGMIRGMRIVSEAELLAIVRKGTDLRKFSVTPFDGGKVRYYAGAVIGDMAAKRQVLAYRTADGLDAVCLTTGKIGKCEKADRAVEVGALTADEKLTIQTQIFSGADMERGKSRARNAVKRARKAASAASK